MTASILNNKVTSRFKVWWKTLFVPRIDFVEQIFCFDLDISWTDILFWTRYFLNRYSVLNQYIYLNRYCFERYIYRKRYAVFWTRYLPEQIFCFELAIYLNRYSVLNQYIYLNRYIMFWTRYLPEQIFCFAPAYIYLDRYSVLNQYIYLNRYSVLNEIFTWTDILFWTKRPIFLSIPSTSSSRLSFFLISLVSSPRALEYIN